MFSSKNSDATDFSRANEILGTPSTRLNAITSHDVLGNFITAATKSMYLCSAILLDNCGLDKHSFLNFPSLDVAYISDRPPGG
jgi:hypothetical protein